MGGAKRFYPKPGPVVIAKCISRSCGKKREIRTGDVARGDMPFCECGMVMVAVRAEVR